MSLVRKQVRATAAAGPALHHRRTHDGVGPNRLRLHLHACFSRATAGAHRLRLPFLRPAWRIAPCFLLSCARPLPARLRVCGAAAQVVSIERRVREVALDAATAGTDPLSIVEQLAAVRVSRTAARQARRDAVTCLDEWTESVSDEFSCAHSQQTSKATKQRY